MVYLTVYEQIASCNECWTAGWVANSYCRLNSVKQAERKLKKLKKELEEYGFVVGKNSAYLKGKYIGDSQKIVIEKVFGSLDEI